MLIKSFGLSDSNVNADISTNVQKLLFKVTFKAAKQADLGGTPYKQARHMCHILFNFVCNFRVTITRYSSDGQGTKQLVSNTLFGDLVEISALNEGQVHVRQVDDADPDDVDYQALFSVDLCNDGAIHCDKDSYLRVEFNGMAPYTYGAFANQNATFEMYSVGSFKRINEHIKYSQVVTVANQKVGFTCDSHYGIIVNYDLDKLFLQSLNNEMLEMRGDELEILANDISDTVMNFGGICLPWFKWRLLPIQLFHSGEMQTVANSSFYLLSNKNYEDIKPSVPATSAAAAVQNVSAPSK